MLSLLFSPQKKYPNNDAINKLMLEAIKKSIKEMENRYNIPDNKNLVINSKMSSELNNFLRKLKKDLNNDYEYIEINNDINNDINKDINKDIKNNTNKENFNEVIEAVDISDIYNTFNNFNTFNTFNKVTTDYKINGFNPLYIILGVISFRIYNLFTYK